ncbi:hypothetical protein SAMN05880501_106227 [Ureibacillus xyleni]|uniref:Uncharacterized protein n=1 Tax=Ureibacillus xyleni TaxID=614648 RepID=A0A285SSW1_9BACL|nr:hypothetical protein [Ureibacillus xyleni]SOC11600.1 hypothetical protein SAMN05880501_106227 [Ureibacillus xyleni]
MISLLNENNLNVEERRRALQRRDANDAYKKNATYSQKVNPMLQALEALLSGKQDKELNDEHILALIEEGLDAFDSIEYEGTPDEGHLGQSNLDVDNSNSYLQHLQSNKIALNEIQQTKSQIAATNEDNTPFEYERFNFRTFDTFTNRGITSNKQLELNLETIPFEKTYNIAIAKYNHHMQMVKSGFTFNQPKISLTA